MHAKFFILTLALIALGGCGGGGGSNQTADDGLIAAENAIGVNGGSVITSDGKIIYSVPANAVNSMVLTRITTIPISDFHDEVVSRGLNPVGEPLDAAFAIEMETDQLDMPTEVTIKTPIGVSPTDAIVFSQLVGNELRYVGVGEFSPSGERISTTLPVNLQGDVTTSVDATSKSDSLTRSLTGVEIPGNGIDDDGDGLIDEMQVYVYPDRVDVFGTNESCEITGAVHYSDGRPAVGAIVSAQEGSGLGLVDVSDEFGRYILPLFHGGTSAIFTLQATENISIGTRFGIATGQCSQEFPQLVKNIVIEAAHENTVMIDILEPVNESLIPAGLVAIRGTVDDSTVTSVQVLVNGQYPVVIGNVAESLFTINVLLNQAVNSIQILARNSSGVAGLATLSLSTFQTPDTTTPLEIASLSVGSAQAGETVTAIISVIGGVPPYSYMWNAPAALNPAGDTIDPDGNASFTFPSSGMFPIRVTARDDVGEELESEIVAHIEAAVTPLEIASLSVGSAQAGETVTAIISVIGGVPPYSYMWNAPAALNSAGDTIDPDGNASFTFPSSGMFPIRVTVRDDMGEVIVAQIEAVVVDEPDTGFPWSYSGTYTQTPSDGCIIRGDFRFSVLEDGIATSGYRPQSDSCRPTWDGISYYFDFFGTHENGSFMMDDGLNGSYNSISMSGSKSVDSMIFIEVFARRNL